MRLVNFRCEKCGSEQEYLYDDIEHIPEEIICTECGKFPAKRFDFKNNKHRWRYIDK